MKRFFVLFLVLGAALLAAPGIIGFQVEGYYQQLMQEMAKGGAQVVSSDYQRGWFGAQGVTRFRLQMPDKSGGDGTESLDLELISAITHGPLTGGGLQLAEVHSEIKLDEGDFLPADYQAGMVTMVGIDGKGESRITLPAAQVEAKEKRPAIEFSGLDGVIRFDSAFEQVSAELTLPQVTLSDDAGSRLKLQELRLESVSRKDASGLMLGGGSFKIARFELHDTSQGTDLSMNELGVEAQSSSDNGNISFSIRYHLNRLLLDEKQYGPAEIQLGLGNLPSPVLLKIQQAVEEINAQQLTEQQKGSALMNVLMGNAPGLLQGDPLITIDRLHVETPSGLVEGRLSLQSVGLQWQELAKGPAALAKLVGTGSLQVPESLVTALLKQKARTDLMRQLQRRQQLEPESQMPSQEQIDQLVERISGQQLELILGQEFLVREGDLLTTEAELRDGLLTVNGKSLPLPPAQ